MVKTKASAMKGSHYEADNHKKAREGRIKGAESLVGNDEEYEWDGQNQKEVLASFMEQKWTTRKWRRKKPERQLTQTHSRKHRYKSPYTLLASSRSPRGIPRCSTFDIAFRSMLTLFIFVWEKRKFGCHNNSDCSRFSYTSLYISLSQASSSLHRANSGKKFSQHLFFSFLSSNSFHFHIATRTAHQGCRQRRSINVDVLLMIHPCLSALAAYVSWLIPPFSVDMIKGGTQTKIIFWLVWDGRRKMDGKRKE